MQGAMARDNVTSKREIPRNQEVLGVECPNCKSHNTFIETYPNTGPEGKCWTCERPVPIPEKRMAPYRAAKRKNRGSRWI